MYGKFTANIIIRRTNTEFFCLTARPSWRGAKWYQE